MTDTTAPPKPFKIARRPIMSAFTWFKNAFLLIKNQPWTQFITISWVILTLLLLISTPRVGVAVAAFMFPALSFGMAEVNQKIRLQKPVNPLDVFSGFHPNHRTRLLAVGGFLAIILIVSLTVMSQFDLKPIIDFSNQLTNQTEVMDSATLLKQFEQVRNDPAFIQATITVNLFALFNLLVMALFAYAPLSVAWQNTQPMQAVGHSLLMIWRNILPLLVLITLIFGLFFALFVTIKIVYQAVPFLALWLALPLSFLFLAFLFSLVFTSYHNIMLASLQKDEI